MPEARKIYVDGITELRIEMDKISEIYEIYKYLSNFLRRYIDLTRGLKDEYRWDGKKSFKDVFGPMFYNYCYMNSDNAKKAYIASQLYNSFSQEQYDIAYAAEKERSKKYYDNMQTRYDDLVKSSKDLAAFKIMVTKNFSGGWRESQKDNYLPLFKKWTEQAKEKYDNPKLKDIYQVRDENWTWFESENKQTGTGNAVQKEKAATNTLFEKFGINEKNHKPVPLSHIERTDGLDIPAITVESIQKHFGYTDVVFGNYVQNKEGKEHAKHFLAAMLDLADLLNWDIKEINKLGGLSLSIGSMGCGSFSPALACYYPNRKVINVTKKRGDGTLAHEWAAAISWSSPIANFVCWKSRC